MFFFSVLRLLCLCARLFICALSIQEWPLYKGLSLKKHSECFLMFGAISKATISSFQKGITFYSLCVKKVIYIVLFCQILF